MYVWLSFIQITLQEKDQMLQKKTKQAREMFHYT